MLSLTMTPAAREKVRRALSDTPVPEPVVWLIEVSKPIKVAPELRDALSSGADESTLRELASKSFSPDLLKERRRLLPGIYPRKQFPRRSLFIIDEIVFYFPPTIASAIKGWVLDVGQDGLVLKDANGIVVKPSQK